MAKNIQVRNVPDRIHRELKRRAKVRGQTLARYVQSLLERDVALPMPEEVFDRIASHPPLKLRRRAADMIREERRSREVS